MLQGLQGTNTYYPNLQVSEVRSVANKGNVLKDYTYTYDANGNLKQITDTTSNASLSSRTTA
ncbi:MAG: hypothetical protein K6T81_18755 [Alicyclobacillus macrosporangiidus]|uniref:hypothetical protein n=1 Tax=Alicyclobacillus macrosporangiidus TaxID=392015 RepID=UPI0034E94C1C|nr:hypothetical protein [Alicyclobacillus macrosporangiidus]